MNGRTLLILILVGILAAVILGSLIIEYIRKKDFEDQVSGRKPQRKADESAKIPYDKTKPEDPQISIDREVLRTKSGQNLLGPH